MARFRIHMKKNFFIFCFIIFVGAVLLELLQIITIFSPGPRTTFYIRSFLAELSNMRERSALTAIQNKTAPKILILWYAKQPYFSGSFNFTDCKYSNCILTEDKKVLNTSQAVLFAYRDMWSNVPVKKNGQIWVIVNIESPASDSDLSHVWDNKFDWSMTYRRDSEILLNYKTFRRTHPLDKNYHEIYKNKTKLVAWAVSNCGSASKRGEYVTELEKYIEVDIYGRCGKAPCPAETMPGCHEALSQKYKFYLGFENSLCKDYVTEKVFHTFLDNSNAVYVARTAPNVKSVLPPKTYIDVTDFNSSKHLAEYLLNIASNENEYISYLKEADKYHIDNERNYWRAMCDLCELMNTYKTRNLTWTGKKYNDWYRKNVCLSDDEITIKKEN
ncbi:glycoprotein 3-alpha-L-fucosyltransferase A-like isoform X2 [Mytilus californianus]|uniref:glycoprotein 3-alpha-L-fucosyltransferase A-like isoform X2 n=1 Tax=Mytilus californianus TaxID=6549 RepID=UPI0022466669|nr:glycoprotein 3-alpha-L-fucosyltransferase A-like isoform X2 [Mytilus californianus]